MLGWRVLKRLRFLSRLFQGEAGFGLYTVEEFREIIDRERTRCDRNSHEFSLVVFNLGLGSERRIGEIAGVLAKRVRCTDEVGWFDGKRIGVVLPDTPTEGARTFAESVARLIEALPHQAVDFSVYTYPSHNFPGNGRIEDNRVNQLTFVDLLARQRQPAAPPPVKNAVSRYPLGSAAIRRRASNGIQREPAEGEEVVSIYRTPFWKRAMDLPGAMVFLIIWAPLFAIMACWIKLVSPGPVLFKQQRIGASGRPFTCWKLRTMHVNSDQSAHTAHVKALIRSGRETGAGVPLEKLDATDDRIIPLGRFIRAIGLDELPQLVNVLRGEMSLVGPRPCLPYEYEEYSQWHVQRCDAIPGLTGLWQVSGKNRTTFMEMMRLDIKYSRQLSFWLDVKILLRTVPAIIDQIRR